MAVRAILVHALLNPPPNCLTHAWVEFERDGVCVDLTEDRHCLVEDFPYYIYLSKRYRGVKRIEGLAARMRNFGPWNKQILARMSHAWTPPRTCLSH